MEDTLKGARVWNPTTKKVQKEAQAHKRGKELFCLCFCLGGGGYKERGGTATGVSSSRDMLSGSRAPSKGVPIASMSCHCHLWPQRQSQALTAAPLEGPETRHQWLPLPPWEHVWTLTTKGPRTRQQPLPLPSQEHVWPTTATTAETRCHCPCLLGSRPGPPPSQSRVLWPSATCCSHLPGRMCGLSLPRVSTTKSQPLPPPPWECTQAMYLHIPYQDDKSQNTLRKKISIPTKYRSDIHTHNK